MPVSRIKNTKRNIIAVLVASGGEMIVNFATRTALINFLGSDYVGLSGLFTSILRIMSLTEIGFASAVAFSMYRPIADSNTMELCAILNHSRKVYRMMGALMMVFSIVILPFLPVIIKGQLPDGINIYLLFFMYVLDSVLAYFCFSYYTSLVTALQHMSRIRIIRLVVHGVVCVIQICILAITRNYYFYMIMSIASTVLINTIIYYFTRKDYPKYVPAGNIPDELRVQIRKRVFGILLSFIGGIVYLSMASIALSKYHGLSSVTIYDNYYLIYGGLCTVISYITEAMKASVGDSIASENTEKNHLDLKKFSYMFMWISTVCSACLLCVYQPFMEIWVGKKLMISNRSMLIIVIAFYSTSITSIVGTYYDGVGLWWKMKVFYIADAVVSFVLPIILGRYFAIAGVMLALVIRNLFIRQIPMVVIVFRYYFKNGLVAYIKSILSNVLVTLLACAISYILSTWLTEDLLVRLILGLLVSLVVSNLLLYITSFRSYLFKESCGFIKSIIR